ncbi:NUDIX hydrolase [Butyrivibrio sp. INlla21]|uniref:NUDIX hydrolase n=1 Tax=Butyrivibrio sp. INlla21 TaxID=1520811 RepID=UPI0008E21A2B|nr:NUDIX hydrolase [Butyrivibrio sp. INlla21]SFU72625.1 ADP-ribose pyrophosphatase [Butyrivibrio sp. INlla21]
MQGPKITKECVELVTDKKFLRVFDLKHTEGKHYYDATRRSQDNLVATKTEEEFKSMLPDAVSCVVICNKTGEEPKLLLSYEYRYPTGRFLLSVPAGLLDPEDANAKEPILTTAIREIHEETGIVVDENKDELKVINPLLFSTPGMTDESNALVCVVLNDHDLSGLTQDGAEGQECFDGFSLITKDEAKKILKDGVDNRGHFYSVYTWAALMYFSLDMWK